MNWSTKQLRAFLHGRLNDTQLRAFVMDHYPELFSQISAWGQSYPDRVLLLIDYCYRRGEVAELTAALTADFPDLMLLFLNEMANSEDEPKENNSDNRLDVPKPDAWDR